MRITYCWAEPSGYLAACVRELNSRFGVDVTVFTWETVTDAPFSAVALAAANVHVLSAADRSNCLKVESLVAETRPDVVVFSGWEG